MDGLITDEVIGLLKDLRIHVDPDNSESTLNGSLELILHTMECVNALRQVNEIIPPDQLDLTGGLFVKAQNEFSAAIGRILMYIMSTKAQPNITELLQITVSKILHLFPESAAHDSYRNGTSLLHHAVSKAFADVRLVAVIHEANPVCAGNPDNEGALPLHRAVANPDIPIDVVKFLMDIYPAGASSADLEGYLPLHWAVNTDHPNIPVIEELIDAHPDGCNTTCNMGSLPMHWAVDRSEPNMAVVYVLMKAYAKALRKGCSAGFLPIHRCVDRPNPSIQCMKALIKKYPKSLEQDNCDGQLPLHRCVDRCDPSLEAVALLIQSYPGALDTPDVEGYVPLHIALDGESPCIPVIKLLIESCMESSTMKTQDGLLPLHYVLNCQDPSEELIELLLNSYPEGAEALAVDLFPEDPAADPLSWSGPWKKRKWTPLTRALELGNPVIVDMIRQAIETVHGDIGEYDRARPVSNDSRRSKGGANNRPRSNHSQPTNSRPTSHSTQPVDEATPLKAENIPGTAIKKLPQSGVRAAATNNFVADQNGTNGVGGARNFSPAGESPAPRAVESAAAPISSSIPTAVPPKQLFPAVGSTAPSANGSVSSQYKELRGGVTEPLPEVSPRGTHPTHSASMDSLLKTPAAAQQPEVLEETPVPVTRGRDRDRDRSRDRESKSRRKERTRGEETDEGRDKERKKHRKDRSASRARHEEGEEDGDRKTRHRRHHRRHHRHHHRHREEGEDGERRRRRSDSRERTNDETPVRKPSYGSSGPGQPRDEELPRQPTNIPGSGVGIAMMNSTAPAAMQEKEAEIAERLRKLELMEEALAKKEAEAAEAARAAYLKEREAQEALERIKEGEAKVEKEQLEEANNADDGDSAPYINHTYSERAGSHKFPPANGNSGPKFQPDGATAGAPDRGDGADDLLKSLEDFENDTPVDKTAMSHKFPPSSSYAVSSGGDQ